MAKTAPPSRTVTAGLPPPEGLRATHFDSQDRAFLILSYPIPRWNIPEVLSRAEALVAERLLAGETCAQIAQVRRTAARTVANQIASIFAKLQVNSRLELAAKCVAKPASESKQR